MQNPRILAVLLALTLLGVLLLFAKPSPGQEEPGCTAGLACIDEVLSKAETEGFAGTVLVAEGDEVLFQKGYGMTAPEGGVPIDENTVYLIGSIVKDFTRMAVFGLEAEGKLSRTDTLDKFFPGVPDDKENITVQQLLDHKSGLPDLIDADGSVLTDFTVDYDYTHFTRDEAVEKTLKAPLLYQPGSAEMYSNSGFALLGAIIEIAAGQPYEEVVRRIVFEPAGMKHTGYRGPDWSKMTLAHGIDQGVGWGTPLDGERWMADGPSWNLRANGGMLGTVPDLHRFLAGLLKDDVYKPEVRASLLDDLRFSQNYGSRYFAGAGSNGIFNSIFFFMVDQKRMIIMITSNSEHNGELDYIRGLLPFAFEKASYD